MAIWNNYKWHKSRNFLHKPFNKCIFQKRKMIGCLNYGEIINTLNPADGDPWDICAFGINTLLPINKIFIIEYFIGELILPNGNHKLIPKIKGIDFNHDRFTFDLILFKNIYEKYKNWNKGTIKINWFF